MVSKHFNAEAQATLWAGRSGDRLITTSGLSTLTLLIGRPAIM